MFLQALRFYISFYLVTFKINFISNNSLSPISFLIPCTFEKVWWWWWEQGSISNSSLVLYSEFITTRL